MLMAMGIMRVLIKSKQVGMVLKVGAIRHRYNNANGKGYDSIQPGQADPSCKVICLIIVGS
jgi:hypothetical protein